MACRSVSLPKGKPARLHPLPHQYPEIRAISAVLLEISNAPSLASTHGFIKISGPKNHLLDVDI